MKVLETCEVDSLIIYLSSNLFTNVFRAIIYPIISPVASKCKCNFFKFQRFA